MRAQIAACVVMAWVLAGCSEELTCDNNTIQKDTSDLSGSSRAWRGCADLCSQCGSSSMSATCHETDDYAHCDCGDMVATICGEGTDSEDLCGAETCP